MTTVRRRGIGGGGVEAKNEFKIENAGEPKQPLVKTAAAKAEWSNSINAGEAAKAVLTLESTSNATKGKINLGEKSTWTEETVTTTVGKGATGARLYLGNTAPIGGIGELQAYLLVEPGTAGIPETLATTPAAAAVPAMRIVAPTGGNTSIATKGTGGAGSLVDIKTGLGGEAPSATEESIGGKGGELKLAGSAGGPGLSTATTSKGGDGGSVAVTTGKGGSGTAVTTGTGGKGGLINANAGNGGSGTTTGGQGGSVKFASGAGGAGGTTGGAGGEVTFTGGAGGGAINGPGGKMVFTSGAGSGTAAGGNIEFLAGKGGEAEKGGTIIFKTEGATERVTIAPSGAVTIKQTLKVAEGSTLEGAVKAEKTLEVKELLTAKGGLTAEGTVTLPTESITEAEIKAEAITSKKVKIGKPTEVGTKIESGKEEENTHGAVLMMAFLTWEAKEEAHIANFNVEGVELPTFEVVTAAKGGKAQYTFMLNEKGKWTITLEKGVTGKLMYQEL